jgi:outer membrane protein TolC
MMLYAVLVVTGLAAGVEATATAEDDQLRGYLIEAGDNHPALRQRYAQWQAALARIPQAQALEDPVLTYAQFLQSEASRARVMLAQRFPWFGALETRGGQAAQEAEALLNALYAERNRVFHAVKRTYYAYRLLYERLELLRAQRDVLDYVQDIVEARLALGMASDDEVLRVSIARTKLDDRIEEIGSRRGAVSAKLAAALGRRDHGLLPWPPEQTPPPPPPELDALRDLIAEGHPSVHALERQAQAAKYGVRLARLEGKPGFTLSLEYMAKSKPRKIRPDRPYPASLNAGSRMLSTLSGATPFVPRNVAIDSYALAASREPMAYSDGGEDDLAIGLSVSLPVWRGSVRAGVREARLTQEALVYDRRALLLELTAAAEDARYRITDNARRYTLYADSLIPQAEQTVESLTEQYAAGDDASFLDLMESVRQVLELKIEQAQTRTRWLQASADLELYLGGPGREEDPRAEQ